MLQQTFLQKLWITLVAGFAAACLLYLFRHIVRQAIWENSDAGWKESLYKSTPTQKVR